MCDVALDRFPLARARTQADTGGRQGPDGTGGRHLRTAWAGGTGGQQGADGTGGRCGQAARAGRRARAARTGRQADGTGGRHGRTPRAWRTVRADGTGARARARTRRRRTPPEIIICKLFICLFACSCVHARLHLHLFDVCQANCLKVALPRYLCVRAPLAPWSPACSAST